MTSRERKSLCDLPSPRQGSFVGIYIFNYIVKSLRQAAFCTLALYYYYPSKGRDDWVGSVCVGFDWTRMELKLRLKLPVLLFFDTRCIEREACACVVWFKQCGARRSFGSLLLDRWVVSLVLRCFNGAHSLDKAVMWRFNSIRAFVCYLCYLRISKLYSHLYPHPRHFLLEQLSPS